MIASIDEFFYEERAGMAVVVVNAGFYFMYKFRLVFIFER